MRNRTKKIKKNSWKKKRNKQHFGVERRRIVDSTKSFFSSSHTFKVKIKTIKVRLAECRRWAMTSHQLRGRAGKTKLKRRNKRSNFSFLLLCNIVHAIFVVCTADWKKKNAAPNTNCITGTGGLRLCAALAKIDIYIYKYIYTEYNAIRLPKSTSSKGEMSSIQFPNRFHDSENKEASFLFWKKMEKKK